jgi:uncharacterized protein (UPF0216 family)
MKIFGWRGDFDNLPITCQCRKQVVISIMNGEHGNMFAPQLRIATAIKTQNLEICWNALNTQRTFADIFCRKLRDENLEEQSFAYCLIEQFGVDFLIKCANKDGNKFAINQTILQNMTFYLKTEDIRKLCHGITIEIEYFGMRRMVSLSMVIAEFEKITLLCDIGKELFGNDTMAEMVIELISMRRDGIIVEVFKTLISGILFPVDKKARLIVELAVYHQSIEHLTTLHLHSPFDLDWCIENINLYGDRGNYEVNILALEYLQFFFHGLRQEHQDV